MLLVSTKGNFKEARPVLLNDGDRSPPLVKRRKVLEEISANSVEHKAPMRSLTLDTENVLHR